MPVAHGQHRGDGAGLAAFARDEGHRCRPIAPCWSSIRRAGTPVPTSWCQPGIDLVFLPAASPELQPAERLWTLVDEPVANRVFSDLGALEAVLVDALSDVSRPTGRDSRPTPTSTGGRPSHAHQYRS